MPQHVVNGALLTCSFGLAPSSLTVLPAKRTTIADQPAANIMDNVPMMNIMPFGMCISLANPMVAAATAAALGVLTPQPCIPVTPSPWVPGSPTLQVGGQPALNTSCQLLCQWGGLITVGFPGQVTVTAP